MEGIDHRTIRFQFAVRLQDHIQIDNIPVIGTVCQICQVITVERIIFPAAEQRGNPLPFLIQNIPVKQSTVFHQRGIILRINTESRRNSRTFRCIQMRYAVDLRIVQLHRIVMYAVRRIRIDLVSNDRFLLPRSIHLRLHLRIDIPFIDEKAPQLIRRLRDQRGIQNNRRLTDTAELLTEPAFFIPSRPVIDKKLPLHQPEHLKVRLLPEIRLQIIRFIGFIIRDDLHFIKQIFTVTDIFCRTAGGQYPNKAYEI